MVTGPDVVLVVGEKVAVAPVGSPLALNVVVPEKPLIAV